MINSEYDTLVNGLAKRFEHDGLYVLMVHGWAWIMLG